MSQEINALVQQIGRRAERQKDEDLVNTFVKIGPLFTALTNGENQIIYGRRGTGKTHLLSYLMSVKKNNGDIVIKIDMNALGSTGGIYSDNNIPVIERATRLLVDFLGEVQDHLVTLALEDEKQNKFRQNILPLLDALAEAIMEVTIDGSVETQHQASVDCQISEETNFSISKKDGLLLNNSSSSKNNSGLSHSITRSGSEVHHIHFGRVNAVFKKIGQCLNKCRIWLLLDEWSEIPLDLQPYLSDLIRRTVFLSKEIVVKIAAIEQRTNFKISQSDELNNYIGLEVGADTDMSVNLDEYLVFDNNSEKSQTFFKEMLYRHLSVRIQETSSELTIDPSDYINLVFTQQNVFSELVRASEGVPRDFINIISLAAQKADARNISMEDIRFSGKRWYNQAKAKVVSSKKEAEILLRFIIEEVIGNRRAKAFLIRSDVNDPLINFLFDERVLHMVKENVSANDQPGVRFKVYSIDYGCYIDLINTTKYPLGLFQIGDESDESQYTEVPTNDYRSIRRAILDLKQFYFTI